MRSKVSAADYLYFLSVKYEIGFDSLFKGLIHARENQEVSCGKLKIQCRQKARNHDVFLITNGYRVVAQFFVPKHFLDQPNRIEELKFVHLFRKVSKTETPEVPTHIRDLRCGMKRINLRARVLDVPKAVLVFTRFGEYARVTNALIADETGENKLCLWNEQVNFVSVGDTIQIENASASKFKCERQLRIGKKGTVSKIVAAELNEL